MLPRKLTFFLILFLTIFSFFFQRNACDIFTSALQQSYYRKKDTSLLSACSLYLACRMSGHSRTLREIANATFTDMSDLGHLQSTLIQQLKLQVGRVRPDSLISRIAQQLRLGSVLTELSRQTCSAILSAELLETTSPPIVATAAVLLTVAAYNMKEKSNMLNSEIRVVKHSSSITLSGAAALSMASVFLVEKTYAVLCSHGTIILPETLKNHAINNMTELEKYWTSCDVNKPEKRKRINTKLSDIVDEKLCENTSRERTVVETVINEKRIRT
jgi:hypothetical protein